MPQDLLDPRFLLKLEILKILGEKGRTQLAELESELGLPESEIVEIVDELSENFMITIDKDKSRISWLAGDNPLSIKPWGWNYIYRPVVGSTMIVAKHYPPWSIILAEHQIRSYGRHNKKWLSNLGGIWMTAKFETRPQVAQLLPMAIPLAICQFLNEKLGVKAAIKWPNDIIFSERKLAGFLIEGEVILGKIAIYLGVGINVNNDPPLDTATSLKSLLNRLIPRNSIIAYIAGILTKSEKFFDDIRKVQSAYLEYLETLGKKVRVIAKNGIHVGTARNVTDAGDLLVETETGTYRLSSGDVIELRHLN
ncbi:MAG: biotin--[acetyl-CoA-carboxylase] ligase [Desulfurococcaceae archaeon]